MMENVSGSSDMILSFDVLKGGEVEIQIFRLIQDF